MIVKPGALLAVRLAQDPNQLYGGVLQGFILLNGERVESLDLAKVKPNTICCAKVDHHADPSRHLRIGGSLEDGFDEVYPRGRWSELLAEGARAVIIDEACAHLDQHVLHGIAGRVFSAEDREALRLLLVDHAGLQREEAAAVQIIGRCHAEERRLTEALRQMTADRDALAKIARDPDPCFCLPDWMHGIRPDGEHDEVCTDARAAYTRCLEERK